MARIAKNETLVGLFLLVAVGAGAAAVLVKGGQEGWIGARHLRLIAPHGRNLREGALVKLNGIPVGVVDGVRLNRANQVEVVFHVLAQFKENVHSDSVATIVEPPFVGATFVELSGGTPEVGEAPEGQLIVSVEETPITHKLEGASKDLEKVVKQVNDFVTEARQTLARVDAIARDVQEGKGIAGEALRDEKLARDIKASVANFDRVATDVAELTAAARRGEGTFGALAKDATLVREAEALLAKANSSVGRLDALAAESTLTLQNINKTFEGATSNADEMRMTLANVRQLSGELAEIAHKVNVGQGTFGALLNDQQLYVEAKGVIKELRETIEDVREQAPINSFIGVVFSAF